MNALLAHTPRFVLMNGKQRIGPQLERSDSDPPSVSIYAFSDKSFYDQFRTNSPVALTPYPLVKDYLQSQITDSNNAAGLIVVDAAGPNESHLNAATMQSVLAAMETKDDHVAISCRLDLVDKSSGIFAINTQ